MFTTQLNQQSGILYIMALIHHGFRLADPFIT